MSQTSFLQLTVAKKLSINWNFYLYSWPTNILSMIFPDTIAWSTFLLRKMTIYLSSFCEQICQDCVNPIPVKREKISARDFTFIFCPLLIKQDRLRQVLRLLQPFYCLLISLSEASPDWLYALKERSYWLNYWRTCAE